MKYSEFTKELRNDGCKFIKHGANHDEWIGINGKTFYVPRHKGKEVPNGLYHAIRKQAGLE